MAGKSKFFRVFVEGNTTDGRVIQRSWIEQMARSYNTKKYAARVWLEHIRGVLPDGPFKAYGDVIAVKDEEVEIDGEKRLALFAQIDPTSDLIRLSKARQKIYTSAEIDPDFAKSGETYLVGLGITDSPASLGTEMLAFAAQHPNASPFSARKLRPENLFTEAIEVELSFEEDAPAANSGESLLARIKDLFRRNSSDDDARLADVHRAVEEVAAKVVDVEKRFASATDGALVKIADLRTEIDAARIETRSQFDRIYKTEASDPRRPPAAGGTTTIATDC